VEVEQNSYDQSTGHPMTSLIHIHYIGYYGKMREQFLQQFTLKDRFELKA